MAKSIPMIERKAFRDAVSRGRKEWRGLPERVRGWLSAAFTPQPAQTPWEWNRDNVDFSLVPNYDTPAHVQYDPEWMPFWKEVVESTVDPNVYQITIRKCSRAGASENVMLCRIRYAVGAKPESILYVTADQMLAESFLEKRIKRSLRASKVTRRKLAAARAREHDIEFPDMDLRVVWPKSKTAFKQDGWPLVMVDEASLLPDGTDEMARKRTESYPFAHIIFSSSPDPIQKRKSDEDPIFVNYAKGDCRRWMCKDPKTGRRFTFEMGTKKAHGLRWSESARNEDGSWNLDLVEKSAHYLTPSGTIIKEQDRMSVIATGVWSATNKDAPANHRSYHVDAFMTPFGSFGAIARAFLSAKAQGKYALRTFIYEYLAEPWDVDIERPEETMLAARIGNYLRGDTLLPAADGVDISRIMTVDVQKDHFWFVIRDWKAGGESCLVEWGRVMAWDDLDQIAEKYRPAFIGVDSGYGQRTQEVYEECVARQMIPMKGDDKAKPGLMPFTRTMINPFEGTRRQVDGAGIVLVVFHSDTCKLMLLDRVRGDVPGWSVYRSIDREYCLHMTSEERGPHGWEKRRPDNHAWDCETMQIVLAMAYGYLIQSGHTADEEEPAATEA